MRRKRWLLLVVLPLLFASLVANCSKEEITGSGNIIEEQREVSNFNEIHVAGIGNLIVTMGDEELVRIKADDNLLPHIKTDVKGGKLRIEIERGFTLNPAQPISYYVTAKKLQKIAFAGSGTIEAGELKAENFSLKLAGAVKSKIDGFSGESLDVEIAGSGKAEIETVHTDFLQVSISGSGNTSIGGGKTEEQKINIAGSGKFEAQNLQSVQADISVAGSGSVTLRASDRLAIDIAGSGSVKYMGSPSVDANIIGSGTVKWIENQADTEV